MVWGTKKLRVDGRSSPAIVKVRVNFFFFWIFGLNSGTATTEKLVSVYPNSKMVAAARDANELTMLAWAVHPMKSTAAM